MNDETQIGTNHPGFDLRETRLRALPGTARRVQRQIVWLGCVLSLEGLA
jgi:hypothetical protein